MGDESGSLLSKFDGAAGDAVSTLPSNPHRTLISGEILEKLLVGLITQEDEENVME